jgi:hypothetical protein
VFFGSFYIVIYLLLLLLVKLVLPPPSLRKFGNKELGWELGSIIELFFQASLFNYACNFVFFYVNVYFFIYFG